LNTLKSQSINGYVWSLIGKLSIQGVGFIVSVILTRILFPEDFGLIAIATVFMNFANLIMDFGFSKALIQRKEVTDQHYSTVFFLNLFIGILLFVIVFLLAPIFGSFYKNDILTILIRFLAINFIISSFGNIIRAKLYREMNFKTISVVNIISSILSGVLALTLAYLDYGIWSLVWQSIIGILLSNILINIFKPNKIKPKFYKKEFKELWSFSSNLFTSGVIDSIFLNLDQLVIGKVLSPITLGFYYRAKNLESFAFNYTAGTLADVLLPSLSQIQDDKEKLKTVFWKLFHVLAIFSFFVCGIIYVNADNIVLLLFTEKWLPMVPLFQILIIGGFSKQIFSLIFNTLLSNNLAKDYLKVNAFNKVLLLLALPLIIYFDLQTYLYAFISIQFVNLFVGVYFVNKIIPVGEDFTWGIFKYLSLYIAIIFLSTFLIFQNHTGIIQLLLNSTVYIVLFIMVFYLFAKTEMHNFWKELKRIIIK
jgi:O-antigen/teichoic acid export membrane protein